VTQLHDGDQAPTGMTPRLDGDAEVWRVVEVESVEMELPGSHPEVVLAEKVPPWRRLRIPVGFSEGNSIAYALHGVEVPRPLTHDLMTELLERHRVEVAALRVTARHNGVFFAELETMGSSGRAVVPCRPSDGMALVLRQRMEVPIIVATWVFDEPEPEPEPEPQPEPEPEA
jgi:bifunctional DNase/RNase